MKTLMVAQILGALTNIALDPLLIFGLLGLPELGIAGAAIATVVGQMVAALVVMRRGCRRPPAWRVFPPAHGGNFSPGNPQHSHAVRLHLLYFGLNLILAEFSDQAVTALGLYYNDY